MKNYDQAFERAVCEIQRLIEIHRGDKEYCKTMLYRDYKKSDPDAKAVCCHGGIRCTSDGLLSLKRICEMEEPEDILQTYKTYRKKPIFFFPAELGGINIARNSVFGDKIDLTLLDIRQYYAGGAFECKLQKTYQRPKTAAWLKSFESFENLIDWYGIKGIFTDQKYNVYDIESLALEPSTHSSKEWSRDYYENLKKLIEQWNNK